MLPYAAYLRVYEPADEVAAPEAVVDDDRADPGRLTRAEQLRSLHAAVRPPLSGHAGRPSAAAYWLERGGRRYVSPTDEQLRTWLSVSRLAASYSPTAGGTFAISTLAEADRADEALQSWRRSHPDAAEHVREATWRLPLSWLLVVASDEREDYHVDGHPTARYLTPIAQARRRVARAHAAVSRHFADADEVVEIADLGRWLEAFHAHSWVELDLAGLGPVVHQVDAAEPDRSLGELQAGVQALREGRLDDSAEAYQRVTAWWALLALREHAN